MSEQTRRRGLLLILIGTFFTWAGFFMVIPLISVHYIQDLGWEAGGIGLVLGVRQLTQQGFTLMGGALADRLGAKWLIVIGMVIRALSFLLMGFADTFTLLMISAILAALGGALFDSPSSAAIAALTHHEERGRYYSTMGVVSGIGMTIGPLVGALLLRINFSFVAWMAAGFFLLASLMYSTFLPAVRVSSGDAGLLDGIALALHDRRFMLFNMLQMGYWFMWVQLTISLPLMARAVSGTNDAVSWVYALNSIMGIVLQYPLLRFAERFFKAPAILVLGIVIMSIGILSVAFVGHIIGLLICVALFALGRLLASPSQQTVVAGLANPAALGSYFGVSALALALGGGLGNLSGGVLYEYASQIQQPALPWILFGSVGLLSAAGLAWMNHSAEIRDNVEC